MKVISIKQGRNIPLKGKAKKFFRSFSEPPLVSIPLRDFRLRQFRPIVKLQDHVKIGTPLLEQKDDPRIVLVSSVSGEVVAINRGEKRALLSIDIQSDGQNGIVTYQPFAADHILELSKEVVVERLCQGGVWPFIRQRPFQKVASPNDQPKSIFVRAMNTDPLAPDLSFLLEAKDKEFQVGLDILSRLTEGQVHVCFDLKEASPCLINAQRVKKIQFSGSHPTGNVGTHIHALDPIRKGEVVWNVEALDVIRIARMFLRGMYDPFKVVPLTGEGFKSPRYVETVIGARVKDFCEEEDLSQTCFIAGSVLNGQRINDQDGLGFYEQQITAIPLGGERKFLGWMMPGFKSFSFGNLYASSFLKAKEPSLDADLNGGHRAIVLNHVYDKYQALNVMTYFLIKAIYAGEIDEMERLGILECAPEDFALASFACPSKFDIGGRIQQGLDMIEAED